MHLYAHTVMLGHAWMQAHTDMLRHMCTQFWRQLSCRDSSFGPRELMLNAHTLKFLLGQQIRVLELGS